MFVPSKARNLPERNTPPNITLGWKGLLGTNALPYLAPSWVMKKKSFITFIQRFPQGGDCPTKAIRLNLAWGQCYKTFILRHVRQIFALTRRFQTKLYQTCFYMFGPKAFYGCNLWHAYCNCQSLSI